MDESDTTCRCCGGCCRTFPIFASDADAAREPRIRDEAVSLEPWLRTDRWIWKLFPLPFHERCCFLDVGNRCVIHPTRPDVCRDFAPGSDQCRAARRRMRTENGR